MSDHEEAKILAASFDEQMQELWRKRSRRLRKSAAEMNYHRYFKRVVVYVATKRKLSEGDKLPAVMVIRRGCQNYS